MMNFTLNKKVLLLGAVFALLCAASAQAQAMATMRVSIPFSFRAGDILYPAGQYTVNLDKSMQRITLAQPDGHCGPMLAAFHAYRDSDAQDGKLVFHKYGKSYFLHSVWRSGNPNGYEIIRSNAEAEMANTGAKQEVAVLRLPAR